MGRSATSVGQDITYLNDTYGTTDFFVYRAQDFTAADWATVLGSLSGVRVWAESFWDYFKAGKVQSFAAAAGFSGVYTYDPFDLQGTDFAGICGSARMDHLLCSPSVAPGFEAVRATGGTAVRSRHNGATYDQMWQGAIDAEPDMVSITSYNEWHEGTQIEPAVPKCLASGFCYQNYQGAYGLSGAQASDAYL
ncbi:MAG: glycoside hydrolase family 71/99 protein [Acidimicrobiales bacterium]